MDVSCNFAKVVPSANLTCACINTSDAHSHRGKIARVIIANGTLSGAIVAIGTI